MNDNEEIVTTNRLPPASEIPSSETHQAEISDQCTTANSAAVEVVESLSTVAAVADESAGEGDTQNEGLNSGEEQVKAEELLVFSEELEVKNEGMDCEEGGVVADEFVKDEEELAPFSDDIGEKNEGVIGEERVVVDEEGGKIEGLQGVTEELEVKNEVRDDAMGENVESEELPQLNEELAVKNEGVGEEREDIVGLEEEGIPKVGMVEETEELKEEDVGDEGEGLIGVVQEEEFKEEEDGDEDSDGMEDLQVNDNDLMHDVMKEEESGEEEDTLVEEVETVKSGSGGKRKRGRNSKAASTRAPARKTVGEDVCFICLDGGDLVLCDRRGCPKAYHPSCVDHDEDFFKTKGRWNCGWHLCNKCGKNAYFTCFTCTFSLCKGCCRDAVVFCVRGNKGFCESCMKTVMMIESSEQNEMGLAAFDDKSSWEYLFKDYWIEQKRKLCITSEELAQAKTPWKVSDASDKQQVSVDGKDDLGTDSDSSDGHLEVTDSKRRKAKSKSKSESSDTDSSSEKNASTPKRKGRRKLKSQTKGAYSDSEHSSGNRDTIKKKGKRPRRLTKSRSMDGNSAGSIGAVDEATYADNSVWASKELLEFVMHMKDGDASPVSQFDVQGLLLEYIKQNKLRDPRRQSQIICDTMLQRLFGKPRVGHFEMLKLLEAHFYLKEDSQADDNHGSVVNDIAQPDADDNTDFLRDAGRSKGKKSRKRGEHRGFQSNLDDYAAIDMHNITLIYLRRNLMEALMEDSETFHDKVVGSFVRIRISGSIQKHDMYRLVQIIGTSKAAESYKVSKKTTDVMLEILNLDKTETIPIDTISNQEFTEEECKRLRQSIKCGLINRMTVGDILEKAKELQEVRVIDWLEAEIMRLSHLRDRASETGRKKQLRECVEKLQVLKTPEERQRRLDEIPEVHADPNMDPSCESEDEDEDEKEHNRQVSNMRRRDTGFFRRGKEHFSPRKGGSAMNDSWSVNSKPPKRNWEPNRSLSGKGFSNRREDAALSPLTSEHTWNGVDKGTPQSISSEKPKQTDLASVRSEYSGVQSDMSPVTPSGSSQVASEVAQTDAKVNESEKNWHYRDPTGKVQGPFSIVQLRKWSNTGYFPAELKIWSNVQGEDDSILLTEALAGRFQKASLSVGLQSDTVSKLKNAPSSDTSKHTGNVHVGGHDFSNLPSPTPGRSMAGRGGKQPSESRWSSNQLQGGNERLPSPTPTSPSSDPSSKERSNLSQQFKNPSVVGTKVNNVGPSGGGLIVQPASISTRGPQTAMPLTSGSLHTQQISAQSSIYVSNQSFAPPNAGINQPNVGPDARNAAQGFSNVTQPGTVQNPPVYAHNWASGFVPRPEAMNANMTLHNPNAAPPQLPHGQWTGAPVNNQASSYGTGYPPGVGNVASNIPTMPSQNAWRPGPANFPWAGQQQQPVNSNMGWAAPPAATAFGPSAGTVPTAVGQIPGPTPGPSAMPPANPTMGWPGSGSSQSVGNANPGWVGQPGNPGTFNGGGAQWNNRQPSFGIGGGQRVCKFHENGHCRKGAACDYMHT